MYTKFIFSKAIPFLFCLVFTHYSNAQFSVTEVGTLPERVSNNAVCEGFVNGVPYLFSFAGIDSTKVYSGIHLKSYRYNIETGESERIADLPDSLGKIGVAASRIGNIIYIAGGYNVFANSSEKTTRKMHRYDINANEFLSDAKQIPVPTDDHVQAVWRDSLIYLITGWNDTKNIPDVQIYDPSQDEWMVGTPVPNLDTYKSFGASGVIAGDTIYYFGGARSSGNFGIQNKLRIGVINPENPTDITWSITTPALLVNGYRMAATTVGNELHWIGGSNKTYNFNAIAYDGSGSVAPNKRDLYLTTQDLEWNEKSPIEVPMDLRGIADISTTVKYLAGGIIDNREVTNKVYRLEWKDPILSSEGTSEIDIRIAPNPFHKTLQITTSTLEESIQQIILYDRIGNRVLNDFPGKNKVMYPLENIPSGVYYLHIKIGNTWVVESVIKH